MVGTNQSGKALWTRVYKYFHTYKDFTSDRDYKSLQQQWGKICLATNHFCGLIAQIENRPPSGGNQQDKGLLRLNVRLV
ncbi:hypothetical protein L1049_007793 [Liquidambar formosana]|uniref:Uncharacterized protein n=1 Tax=Liquidambar formosana TaxID=63359 RepID=A0AAP0S2F4_LIQFO